MHILSVEFKNCNFSPETGRHHATLLVEARERRVCLLAAAKLSETSDRGLVRNGLVADALRQLGRLPEYRNTHHKITLAGNALPELV